MGLLDKTNPRATPCAVLRHAFVVGLVGALVFLLSMLWKDSLREHWVVELSVWTCVCAFVGGLWKWQVRDEDAEEDDG